MLSLALSLAAAWELGYSQSVQGVGRRLFPCWRDYWVIVPEATVLTTQDCTFSIVEYDTIFRQFWVYVGVDGHADVGCP